nr:glutathione S-transferase [Dendroctonus rhizophagus]
MTPKVYGIYGSPPFGAVLMCANVLEIKLDIEIVNILGKAHLQEDFVQKNPQHTVPLLDDGGFLLADSHAINGYLVGTYGSKNDPLYPKDDIKRRALIDHRMYLDCGIIAARGFVITRPLGLNDIQPVQRSFDDLKEGFTILDRQIKQENSKYIVGNQLSIADFSITSSVTCWGVFVKNWENEFPNIKAYIDRMKQESWFEVHTEGINAFQRFISAKLKVAL